ncbi:unnamed protein product, partial [Larinioides sclopetarius]
MSNKSAFLEFFATSHSLKYKLFPFIFYFPTVLLKSTPPGVYEQKRGEVRNLRTFNEQSAENRQFAIHLRQQAWKNAINY